MFNTLKYRRNIFMIVSLKQYLSNYLNLEMIKYIKNHVQ